MPKGRKHGEGDSGNEELNLPTRNLKFLKVIKRSNKNIQALCLPTICNVNPNILSTKHGRGLNYVIGGDTNDLKLDPILSLDSNFVQVVQEWTRLNPPALLDPVIMTLAHLYQEPMCLEPLDPDPDKNGKKSDHRIVLIRPINVINNKPIRRTREIKVRPFSQSGMDRMRSLKVQNRISTKIQFLT